MKQKIKILHLEDSPSDAGLVARELEKGNINCEILVVDSKENFEKALKDFFPDIILSDHSLACFDSHEALRMVKESNITVPFILITATMTDEFAVNVMKEGAQDYIIKDRLHRLPSVVINSIEKHRSEAEQQAEHERLLFHIENTPLGYIEWDEQLKIKSLSKRTEEIFGWTLKEFSESGRSGYSEVYEEDRPWVNKIAEQLLSGEMERNHTQHRNITSDGRVIWCEWFNSVLKAKDGKVITIMSLVQDITERKTIEVRLANKQRKLEEAQAMAQVGNWDIDLVNNSQVWSAEFYKIFGMNKEETTPSTELFLSFIHPDDFNYANERVGEAFKTQKNSSFDFRFIGQDGNLRYGYTGWRFEFDENRNPIRLFGIIQDVTERKLAEIERTKMVNDLMLRNRDLEQFTYIVSHNLRAPVANILGASNALSGTVLSTEEKDILRQGLTESVLRLDNVVTDLNHILQVKGGINETKEKVCLSELVNDIKTSIQNLIDRDNIEVKFDFSEIDELLTLKSYLYSIFYNLITNSIKFRQQQVPGVIEIKSHRVKNKIELIFTDNGMGIDLQKKGEQVFGLYRRFHSNLEGKGMGLFMVKTQVETLGGKISIKSTVNIGTEFKIEFEI